MDKGDIVSSMIAAVSAVVAGISLFVAVRFARRQTQLQEQVAVIEEGRRREEVDARLHARVTARIADPEGRNPELVLANHGPAEARSVGFTLSAASQGNLPEILHGEILPLNVLHPDVPMSFPLLIGLGDCGVLKVEVTWTDDAGSQKKDFKVRVS